MFFIDNPVANTEETQSC